MGGMIAVLLLRCPRRKDDDKRGEQADLELERGEAVPSPGGEAACDPCRYEHTCACQHAFHGQHITMRYKYQWYSLTKMPAFLWRDNKLSVFTRYRQSVPARQDKKQVAPAIFEPCDNNSYQEPACENNRGQV